MPRFSYTALDAQGNAISGVAESISASACVNMLREQGLRPTVLDSEVTRPGLFTRKERLTWEDLNLLNQQLVAITRGGLPLAESLRATAQGLRGPRLRAVLKELSKDLERGRGLSEAIERRDQAFPPVYIGLLRAGERSGNLSGVLDHLCSYSARMVALKREFAKVIAYPLLVLFAICAFTLFLVRWVVPELASFYTAFQAPLPWATRLLANAGELSARIGNEGWGYLAALLLLIVLAVRTVPRSMTGACAIESVVRYIPLLKRRYYAAAVSRFSRAFGMLLANRAPLPEAITLAAGASGSGLLARAAARAVKAAEKGLPISEALGKTGFFRGVYLWTLEHAERAGNLESTLLMIADDCEEDVREVDRIILALTEPTACAFLGALLVFLVIALYLPVYSMVEYLD